VPPTLFQPARHRAIIGMTVRAADVISSEGYQAGSSMDSGVPSVSPQPVVAALTRSAIFLVATINPGSAAETAVRGLCADLSSLLRAVGFRDLQGNLSCVMAIGSQAWDRLFDGPRPKELHPFREIRGVHHAVSTPGDLLFHIRASKRMDLCFELARQIMIRLDGAVTVVDEVHGFNYFDDRDLIGFVDGTENPAGPDAVKAAIIGDEDAGFAGGSYVIVQKYLHNLAAWDKVPVEEQENIVGRHKLSDIEQPDAIKKPYAHNVLTSITEDGEPVDILRDNMPFGQVGAAEFGTYFIGYSRTPRRIERMLENMFVGSPPGTYDRLLDFSRAVTGSLFFVPTATFLDAVVAEKPVAEPGAAAAAAPEPAPPAPPSRPSGDGSLGIGSLKKEAGHE
jgi:putative iron-dependent peroxidase